MGDLQQEQRRGLLSKEEALDQVRFSEESESQTYTFPLRKNFFAGSHSRRGNTFMTILSVVSLCANAILLTLVFVLLPRWYIKPEFSIAGLVPNAVTRQYSTKTPYSHPPNVNVTYRDELWANIRYDRGTVVIDQKTVDRLGLDMDARVFPWDTSKRVYYLNSYHQLHCLKGLYESLRQVKEGGPLERYDHSVHCLDALRQDVMCKADDELMYVTRDHEKEIGDGHWRQCRDFDALEQWAVENSACYTFEKLEPPFFEDQTFANCPPGSPYYEAMLKELGLPDGWVSGHTPNAPTFLNGVV